MQQELAPKANTQATVAIPIKFPLALFIQRKEIKREVRLIEAIVSRGNSAA